MEMERNKYNCYLAIAENISGIETKRLKRILPIIIHFKDGKFREFYTDTEVYIGDSYLANDFLESECGFFIDKRSPIEELTYDYAITPYNFYVNYLYTEIVPDIEEFSKLTIAKKEEIVKMQENDNSKVLKKMKK